MTADLQQDAEAIGRAFHQTLEAYLGTSSHPQDAGHDLAVGEALLAFGRGEDPQAVVRRYNSWALVNQYALIRYVGPGGPAHAPGTQLVDIQTAILAVGPDGSFDVVQPPVATESATGQRRRLLPPQEWEEKLKGTSLEFNRPDPEHSGIVVVEEDGKVVACWAAITTVHLERLWKAPDHRDNLGTSRALLQEMVDQLQRQGITEVLTNAETPAVAALLRKVGAHPLPGETWVLPIPRPGEDE